jgi:hypothetical protein
MFEKILFFILLIISVALMFSSVSTRVLAAENYTTMDVNVTELSQITLHPTYLNWTQIIAGTRGGSKNITVKNTGSVNVSQIYAYVDTLTDEYERPYQSSNSTKYAAGGVVTIKNETDAKFYYLGKIEWNWTEDISSHNWIAVVNPVSWGYFRNLTNSYVWLVGNGTPPAADPTGIYCNDTGTELAIEDDIDTGDPTTRYPDDTSITRNAGDANYGYFSVNRDTAPLYQHCVAVATNCQKIYIYNFDQRTSPNFAGCTEADHLYYGNLTSGDTIILKVDPWVPWGYPAGNLSQATLTVVGS